MTYFFASQAKEATGAATDAGKTIIEYGLLGALFILSLFALVTLAKWLLKAKDDHLEDRKDMMGISQDQTKEFTELSAKISDAYGDMSEEIKDLQIKVSSLETKQGERFNSMELKVGEFIAVANAIKRGP